MKRFAVLLLAYMLALGVQEVNAQRQLERGLILNPFIGEASQVEGGTTRWMHHWGGWVGFSRYALVRDDDHLWLHQLGGYIELARFGPSASLLVTSQVEFVADPANDINFNPRSVFWEEGLLFTRQMGEVGLQLGYYHRCKHDADNLQRGEQRTLIFGSLTGRVTVSRSGWIAAVKTDLYTIRQDFRLPAATRGVGLDWNKLLASGEVILRGERAIGEGGWNVYASSRAGLSIFSASDDFVQGIVQPADVRPSGGLSAGLSLRRDHSELRFNVDFEYLPDTGLNPIPTNAPLLRLGVMAIDPLTAR